jgi:nicotinamide riboside kinase
MKFNKICIVGAPCVGKSTLIKPLSEKINCTPTYSRLNQTRQELFNNKGFEELTDSELIEVGTKAIMNRINIEKKQKILLSEGGIFYDYSWMIFASKNILKKELDFSYIEKIILKGIKQYNLILFIPIEFEFKERNKPYDSKETQKEIDKILKEILNKFNIKYLTITGKVEDRLNSILKIIK